MSSRICLHVGPGEHGEDVEPPFRFLAWRALEEVDAIGRRQRQTERMARHFFGFGNLHHFVHVDDGLRNRFGLTTEKEKKNQSTNSTNPIRYNSRAHRPSSWVLRRRRGRTTFSAISARKYKENDFFFKECYSYY